MSGTVERARSPVRETQIVVVDARPLLRLGLARLARLAGACDVRLADDLAQVERRLGPPGPSTERVLVIIVGPRDDPAVGVIRARSLAKAVVLAVDGEEPASLRRALAAGADAVMLVDLVDDAEFGAVVAAACAGEKVTPVELLGSCLGLRGDDAELTARSREVLRLLAAGLHNDEIAERLGISTSAVRKHIASAQARLRAVTRAQAVAIAADRGHLR
jgi:DNA-binding NarL/FixJ family response regulator